MTENKSTEDKLKECEDRFYSYFNMPLNGIAMTSPEKGWLEVNNELCSMLGYTRDELLKKTWSEMTHPDDIDADEKEFNKILSGQIENYNLDKRYIRKDGTTIWTNLSVGCVREPNGNIKYSVAIIKDITDRKIIEKELQKQNLLLNTILENAPIGFAVNKISDGKALFVSSKFEEIYGVERKSINSTDDFYEKVYIDPTYRKEMREKTTEAMMTKDPAKMKWENIPITTLAGKNIYITAINIPVPEQDLMVSTVQDVTEKKMDEDSLKEKLEEIEKMNDLMIGRELEMIKLKKEVNKKSEI